MIEMQPPPPQNSNVQAGGGLSNRLWKERTTMEKLAMIVGLAMMLFALSTVVGERKTDNEVAAGTVFLETLKSAGVQVPMTTVAETWTTQQATTTTEAPLDEASTRLMFSVFFDNEKGQFVYALSAIPNAKSVNALDYDLTADVLTLEMTPESVSDSEIRDMAWVATRVVALFWKFGESTRVGWPGPYFRLKMASISYECAPEVMVAITNAQTNREQWELRCRVS
jgi:hypothetical protein